jgi:hypothetical protein
MVDSQIVFRWAVGDLDTQTMRPFCTMEKSRAYQMSRMSILSFQRRFPSADFVVGYNGKDFNAFKRDFEISCPSLIKGVTLFDSRQFPIPYHFTPESGVWWKWIPFRYAPDKTEIYVDSDIICLRSPDSLKYHLEQSFPIILISDIMPYFCERVVGDYVNHAALKNRIPVNCGFVAFKPGVTFEKQFIEASKSVNYAVPYAQYGPDGKCISPYDPNAGVHVNFLDEQGCFNVGLYASDIPFALLSRGACCYGPELRTRLEWEQKDLLEHKEGQRVEMCHFIGKTKSLFWEIQMDIFRSIYDEKWWISPLGVQPSENVTHRGIRLCEESF